MNYKKEIDWLRANGVTGNRFKSEDHDDFTIGWLAKLLNIHAEETVKKLNEPAVSVVREPVASGAVCPHFNACQNGGKNEYCDLQTFNEIDCFVGQTER